MSSRVNFDACFIELEKVFPEFYDFRNNSEEVYSELLNTNDFRDYVQKIEHKNFLLGSKAILIYAFLHYLKRKKNILLEKFKLMKVISKPYAEAQICDLI